jgi:hypothetical protein
LDFEMVKRQRRTQRLKEQPAPYGRWTATIDVLPASLLDIGERYMEQLKEKALKVSRALSEAAIPHAVIGGLALAAQISRVNPSAERNTKDLDILLNRSDLERAKIALEKVGFRYRKVMRLHAFMPNQKGAKFEDGVHIVWSGEKVRDEYLCPAPSLSKEATYQGPQGVAYLGLRELLIMKLTSFRLKDKVHIQDLLLQKLITKKIEASLPAELLARLKEVKEETERERL